MSSILVHVSTFPKVSIGQARLIWGSASEKGKRVLTHGDLVNDGIQNSYEMLKGLD